MEVYDFGKRLQSLRKKKKLTQKDVADRLQIHPRTVSSYERNQLTPSYEILRQMAVMYDASLDYIAGLTDRPSVYLDRLSLSQQKLILDFIEGLKRELEKPGD